MNMKDGTRGVSVTFDDVGEVTSIEFSGEGAARDLERPDGQLGLQPMSLADIDTLVGYQTVSVLVFKSAAGTKRICVKLMNCDYFCR